MNLDKIKEKVRETVASEFGVPERVEVVGSTYITDAVGRDVDVLVYAERDEAQGSVDAASFGGWDYGGSVGEGTEGKWGSWKRDLDGVAVNLLLCTDLDYFNAWLTAAEVCRLLFLQDGDTGKGIRVAIHNIIMDDSTADDEHRRLLPPGAIELG